MRNADLNIQVGDFVAREGPTPGVRNRICKVLSIDDAGIAVITSALVGNLRWDIFDYPRDLDIVLRAERAKKISNYYKGRW